LFFVIISTIICIREYKISFLYSTNNHIKAVKNVFLMYILFYLTIKINQNLINIFVFILIWTIIEIMIIYGLNKNMSKINKGKFEIKGDKSIQSIMIIVTSSILIYVNNNSLINKISVYITSVLAVIYLFEIKEIFLNYYLKIYKNKLL